LTSVSLIHIITKASYQCRSWHWYFLCLFGR